MYVAGAATWMMLQRCLWIIRTVKKTVLSEIKRNDIFLKILWFMFGLTYNDNREREGKRERERREREKQ